MRGPLAHLLMRDDLGAGGRVLMALVTGSLFLSAARALLRRCLLLEAGEFDYGELGRIAAAEAEFHDAGVATRALLVAWRDLIEELLDCLMRLQIGKRTAFGCEVALLSERHHPIREATQLLGLLIGRGKAAALYQREEHVLEQSPAMSLGPI